MHAVRSTWVLTFRPDVGPDLRFILCEDCAKERLPIHAILDLEKLDSTQGFEDLEEHLELVTALRADPEERYFPIRDADLHRLAQKRGVQTDHLVDELEAAEVLRRRNG
ncbi:MAG: hypothetical protein R3343_11365 [Nitriliruptorales bacterium]|nr:hypothetical protein [Nitriliruptorales bacterium]